MYNKTIKDVIIQLYEKYLPFELMEESIRLFNKPIINDDFYTRSLQNLKNLPEPFILHVFFYRFCYMNGYENKFENEDPILGSFERSDVGAINNFISFLKENHLEDNIIIEFLIQLKQYYEKCINDFKEIKQNNSYSYNDLNDISKGE